jgi:DNA polymerase-1
VSKRKKIALIDADVLVYRAACVATEEVQWDEDTVSKHTNFAKASHAAHAMVKAWTKAAGCSRARLLFSDRTKPRSSFRYEIHPHYKANRKPEAKPDCLGEVEAWAMDRFDGHYYAGLEGDDALGLEATEEPGRYVIVSTDKDMLTVPGDTFIIPCGGGRKPKSGTAHHISPFRADYNWFYQTLIGDVVDNYKGAPGIGKVAATRILAGVQPDCMWDSVLEAFADQWDKPTWQHKFVCQEDQGKGAAWTAAWYAEALMNARCARILRYGDYDMNRVRLWSPEGPDEWMQIGGDPT